MDPQTRDSEVFSKDDWILYFLNKHSELLHRDIITKCRNLKIKASNQKKIACLFQPKFIL